MSNRCIAILTVVILISAACSPGPRQESSGTSDSPKTGAEEAELSLQTGSPPLQENIEQPVAQQDCTWVWSTSPLPDLTAGLEEALIRSGLPLDHASARAYGENCLDPQTDVFQYFVAMQTEFDITLVVEDTGDITELVGLLRSSLQVLQDFPADETPGPNPGLVDIHFSDSAKTFSIRFNHSRGLSALEESLSDSDLFEQLQSPSGQ